MEAINIEDMLFGIPLSVLSTVLIGILTTFGLLWCLCRRENGITRDDLRHAQRVIAGRYASTETPPRWFDVGIRYNNWRKPVEVFAPDEQVFKAKVENCHCIKDYKIKGDKWERARLAVDAVLNMLIKEIRAIANKKKYKRLSIQKYVKQGSSREGLKVIEANEFDNILQFEIQGFEAQVEPRNGRPDLGLVKLMARPTAVKKACPALWEKGVFFTKGDNCYLSAENIYESIFKSIIDTATNTLEQKINNCSMKDGTVSYRITRKRNPPSVNITIEITEKSEHADGFAFLYTQSLESRGQPANWKVHKIDIDVVPGIVVAMENVPDPSGHGRTMKCPRYAVLKWEHGCQSYVPEFSSQDLVWRICSSGYEKHIFDICKLHKEQLYIVTALRLVKTYFSKAKKSRFPPPQLVTVLRSYHLKMIAFYCILYLTVINEKKVSGVREALSYLLAFLEVCLQEECLPNFFNGNGWILYMFPHYGCEIGDHKVNMLHDKSYMAIYQALLSFYDMKEDLSELDLPTVAKEYVEKFRQYVNPYSPRLDKAITG